MLTPCIGAGFVAVVGRPNVGKSTLVNRLLGQKVAIVSPKPQTTRDQLLGILTRSDAQVVFIDTPGIHHPLHRLGTILVDTARSALPDCDVVLWVVDASAAPTDEDRMVAALLTRHDRSVPVVLALNECDRLERIADVSTPSRLGQATPASWLEAYGMLVPRALPLLVSATRGDHLDGLLGALVDLLPPGPPLYDDDALTDQPVRFMAAELVREQVLLHLHDGAACDSGGC